MNSNPSFLLFPDTCPTGDTSGCQVPLADLISKRAYALFESRGRGQSREIEDWFKAEHEISTTLDSNEQIVVQDRSNQQTSQEKRIWQKYSELTSEQRTHAWR